eukprot:jgi/Chlat1/4109/Chrsp26S04009
MFPSLRRLSAELARYQARDGPLPPSEDFGWRSRDGEEGWPSSLPDTPWLAPLLSAYDRRTAELQSQLQTSMSELKAVRVAAESAAAESARLAADVERMESERDASYRAHTLPELEEEHERTELLRKENAILLSQQTTLDEEVNRLHERLQSASQEGVHLRKEYGSILARLEDGERGLSELESEKRDCETQLQKAREQVARLSARAAGAESAVERGREEREEERRGAAESAAQMKGGMETMRMEMAAAMKSAQAANESAATRGSELDIARSRLHAAMREAAEAQRDKQELKQTVTALEARVAELTRHEADTEARMQEALALRDEASSSKSRHDLLSSQAESVLSSLASRLAAARKDADERASRERREIMKERKEREEGMRGRIVELEGACGRR